MRAQLHKCAVRGDVFPGLLTQLIFFLTELLIRLPLSLDKRLHGKELEVDRLIGLADKSVLIGRFTNYRYQQNLTLIVVDGCAASINQLLIWNH